MFGDMVFGFVLGLYVALIVPTAFFWRVTGEEWGEPTPWYWCLGVGVMWPVIALLSVGYLLEP